MLVAYNEEMSRMNTATRVITYFDVNDGRPLTPRQRRRLVKKAGADPRALVERSTGMGFSPARRGERVLLGYPADLPVSGAPTGTGLGHHAVDAWLDEEPF